MLLTQQHLEMIKVNFAGSEREAVEAELARLTTTDTWDSEYNFNNAIGAILALSKGDMPELVKLVDAARVDFRDVIYWWSLAQKQVGE